MSDGKNLPELAAAYTERHAHSSLSISKSDSPPSLVIALSGSLDSESSTDTAAFLRFAINKAAEEGGLCVDLASVTYVSSTGIGALATAMMEYERIRVPFRLRSVPDKIRDLFKLLGLWDFFKIVEENGA
jgi:anti-anti-sigma factor